MDDVQPVQPPHNRTAASFAAILVMTALGVLYWRFSGDSSPDWYGYGQLYDDEGGWLLRTGREPGFVWFISLARTIFGSDNYSGFRFSLFCIFAAFAAWLTAKMPDQIAIRPVTSLVTALIVITAFLLKGLVQIREGVAFLFIIAPAVVIFTDWQRGMVRSGLGAVLAGAIHAATIFFAGAWLAAIGIWLLPDRIVRSPALQRVLLTLSIVVGGSLALSVLRNIDTIDFLLKDFGVDRWSGTQSALSKYLYWIVNGAFVILIRHQLLAAVETAPKFAFTYATAIASILLPTTYSVCITLVVAKFQIAAVTSMAIRVLFTTSEFALIVIALRGRANLGTAAMAIAMLADRARLLATP